MADAGLRFRDRLSRRLLVSHALVAILAGMLVWLLMREIRPAIPTNQRPIDANSAEAANADPGTFSWTQQPAADFAIPPYARHLREARIVLDPGHGGRAHLPNYKRGPTGLREAEVNLRVAHHLREFLEAVGAEVIMTRTDDRFLHEKITSDLEERARIANEAAADLFLSIHHNAAENPSVNYSLVFYHGLPDASPASLCAARQLLIGLNDALRLERQVECALRSDYVIYPNEGFRVLRKARVPAVLTESSFHSNPAEEQRLRNALYNRREAYGLFLGLARWAQSGFPYARIEPAGNNVRDDESVIVRLYDGLSHRGAGAAPGMPKIMWDSLVVRIDGMAPVFTADRTAARLRVMLPDSLPRDARLYVDFANHYGQHVLHPALRLE